MLKNERQIFRFQQSTPPSLNSSTSFGYSSPQRSRWLKESLVNEQELTSFENKLVDEWERYCDALRDEGVGSDEQSLMSFGRKVLRWAEQETTHLKIRPRVDADFVRRGSFHILADQTPEPSIYWHPEFMKLLAESIAKATKENVA